MFNKLHRERISFFFCFACWPACTLLPKITQNALFFANKQKKSNFQDPIWLLVGLIYIKGKQKVKKMGIERIYLRKYLQGNTKNTNFAKQKHRNSKKAPTNEKNRLAIPSICFSISACASQ